MKFLLITPPLTQVNTPYPATATLKGYLCQRGFDVAQADLGIELVDRIMTKDYLEEIGLVNEAKCVDQVMKFLRGQDDSLAPRIANRSLLPEGTRFDNLADMEWAFGTAGTHDKARYLATLFIEQVADFVRENIDGHFDLIRYAEHLSNYAPTFDELYHELQEAPSKIDQLMIELLEAHIEREKPDIVGFSIPFPGCLYGALRCSQYLRSMEECPMINFGGGFPNTEWRQLSDTRLFEFCHNVTLDDGEVPLTRLAQFIEGEISHEQLVRTLYVSDGKVVFSGNEGQTVPFGQNGTPEFEGLPLEKYFSMAEMTNPMHRLWSCGRWNKIMVAHGCYWAKCAFCDTTLDYIGRYDAPEAAIVVDRMEKIANQTNCSGFHFVDEALPPKLLKEMAQEIIKRGDVFTWWGNIRFEKAYTQELCDLLADAGCIAVSGGLEVASDRLLKLMSKGVTIDQTVSACRHLRNAGIMVHTYLMYGFPTETLQESLDALETVRGMFDEGIVQSAFWHRYAMTCHSESGKHPGRYGARRINMKYNPFCNNEVDWEGENGQQFDYDIEAVGDGLRFATYNYMNDIGLEMPVKKWFPKSMFKKNSR